MIRHEIVVKAWTWHDDDWVGTWWWSILHLIAWLGLTQASPRSLKSILVHSQSSRSASEGKEKKSRRDGAQTSFWQDQYWFKWISKIFYLGFFLTWKWLKCEWRPLLLLCHKYYITSHNNVVKMISGILLLSIKWIICNVVVLVFDELNCVILR